METSRDTDRRALADVSETLFIPLYCRALETRSEDPIIKDPKAVEIFERLGIEPPFQRRQLRVMIALRTKVFDACVRDFLSRTPDGVVVNMGCGLDTRFTRMDNGRCRWYDLDLPGVIDIRKRFFEETDRHRSIASSVLEVGWMDDLAKEHPGRRFLFLAEGLFMYLHGEEVKSIVLRVRERFPGAELAFETVSAWGARIAQSRLGRRKFRRRFHLKEDAVFNWGMEDSHVPETWQPGIKLLDEWFYFQTKERKWGWYRWLLRIPRFGRIMWIAHYLLA